MRIFPKREEKPWYTTDEIFAGLRYRSWWHQNSIGGRVAFFFLRFKYIGKHFEEFVYKLKKIGQIIVRGFSDEEVWEFHYHATRYIYPRLVMFKDRYTATCPGLLLSEMFPSIREFTDEQEKMAHDRWFEILDTMIYAFGKLMDESPSLRTDEANQRIEDGLFLFAKYYQSLWD